MTRLLLAMHAFVVAPVSRPVQALSRQSAVIGRWNVVPSLCRRETYKSALGVVCQSSRFDQSEDDYWGLSPATFTGNENVLKFFSKRVFTGYVNGNYVEVEWTSNKMELQGIDTKKTVRQVFEEAGSREAAINTLRFLNSGQVGRFYDLLQNKEHNLAIKGIIAVNGQREIRVINEYYTPLTLSQRLINQGLSTDSKTDHIPPEIFMVLGSSGSGKTFFSVKALPANVPLEEGVKQATVYVLPGMIFDDSDGKPFHTVLLQYIKEKIEEDLQFKFKIVTPLKMHLTVVMDEAGSGILNEYFEKQENLNCLHSTLKENLATSIWLVVCGTGLHGNELSSLENIRKFRMGLWTNKEADELLRSSKLFPEDAISGLIHGLSSQATLQALMTNARSAFFLLDLIKESHYWQLKWRDPINWVDRLRELTPSLVASVVATYINNNALRGKERKDVFCIAASVFRAVEQGRNIAKTSTTRTDTPMFLDLPFQYRHIAKALIDSNVEVSGGKVTYIQTEITSSVIVSPAILVVLFSLLGVQVGALSSLHAQVPITALVVFRERARSMYEAFLERGNLEAFQQRWATEKAVSIDKLEYSLLRKDLYGYNREKAMILATELESYGKFEMFRGKLDMVKLFKSVPERSSSKEIYIPIVDNEVICINGDRAPFADVFTSFVLCQSIHTGSSAACAEAPVFSTADVLWNCGLLREQDKESRGRIVLRGLYALWTGELGHVGDVQASSQLLPSTGRASSKAYPFNMLNSPLQQESTTYAKLSKVNGVWVMENGHALPELPQDFQLTFVVSTNAASIDMDMDIVGFLQKKLNKSEAWMEKNLAKEVPVVEEGTLLLTKEVVEEEAYGLDATAKTVTTAPCLLTVTRNSDPVLPAEFLKGVMPGVHIDFLFT